MPELPTTRAACREAPNPFQPAPTTLAEVSRNVPNKIVRRAPLIRKRKRRK